MEPILLASGSERRRELLSQYGIPLVVRPPDIDESVYDHIAPGPRTGRLAEAKAKAACLRAQASDPRWVLAADTLVVSRAGGERVLGKPADADEALRFIGLLQGAIHEVYTGVAITERESGRSLTRVSGTRVRFARMSAAEMRDYVDSGEWRGVAGAYRIQERAAWFVEHIEGSYSGVVGLPISDVYGMLAALGYRFG